MADNGIDQTDENDKLTPKQRAAIVALMEERDIRSAARACKVGERTIYRWLNDPTFQAELKQAEQELINTCVRRLAHLTGEALDTIAQQMRGKVAPGVKVRAGDVLLSHLLDFKKLAEFESRLEALEQASGGKRT